MNQNPKNNAEYPILAKSPEHTPQVSQLIAALEIKYATNVMVLSMLSAIAIKIEKVPLSVQATVAELLRANLDSKIANTGLITAAIMATNPKNLVQNATNDDRFELAA